MKENIRWAMVCLIFSCCFLLAVQWGSRGVQVLSRSVTPGRSHCIVVDPGHGGEDGGAVAVNGKPESGYNLEIALILRDVLQLLGYETVMTRESDISIHSAGNTIAQRKLSDLKERLRITEETPGAVLISIHQNTFPEGRYTGAQVFYADSQQSKALAETMQHNMVKILNPGSNRKSKQGEGIYLLEHLRCTGILIECGFLSNPGEASRLQQKEYQQAISCVVAGTAAQFLSNT